MLVRYGHNYDNNVCMHRMLRSWVSWSKIYTNQNSDSADLQPSNFDLSVGLAWHLCCSVVAKRCCISCVKWESDCKLCQVSRLHWSLCWLWIWFRVFREWWGNYDSALHDWLWMRGKIVIHTRFINFLQCSRHDLQILMSKKIRGIANCAPWETCWQARERDQTLEATCSHFMAASREGRQAMWAQKRK